MTKECVAIKTGMLLKYADEPSWVIVSNDLNELREIEKKCLFKRGGAVNAIVEKW